MAAYPAHIVLTIDDSDTYATVEAIVEPGDITTHGAGRPNVTHYGATIGGHRLAATWADNARHAIQASIPADHPLASAVRLISRRQRLWAELRDMRSRERPSGYAGDQWPDVLADVRRQLHAALDAERSDAVAAEISPRSGDLAYSELVAGGRLLAADACQVSRDSLHCRAQRVEA